MYESSANATSVHPGTNGTPTNLTSTNGARRHVDHLRDCEALAVLTAEQRVQLAVHGRIQSYSTKAPVYLPTEPADNVFVMIEGFAKVCHLTKDGKESILAFIEPGEIFGERAVFESRTRDEYVETIDASKVLTLPVNIMRRLVESRADICVALMKVVSDRRHRIENRLKNLLFLSNRERLLHLLLDLSVQFGVPHVDGIRLRIKLSHQELANLIGSTRETVTVLLGQLKAEHCVAGGRQKIILTDPQKLAREVGRVFPVGGYSR